jgi:hypothetical protein
VQRIFRLFDTVLILFLLASLAVAASFFLAFGRSVWTVQNVLLFGLAPLVVGLGLAASFKLRAEVRATISMVLVFSAMAVYGVEIFLEFAPPGDEPELPPGYDRRPVIEVIGDLRAQGQRAYPLVTRPFESHFEVRGVPLVPLAGIPDVTTVVCNETGEYLIYRSDRFGFNNPDGAWGDDVQIALIGDSFTQGACVPEEQSFASLIRAGYPGTLNLGYSDHGPLSELATVYEYAEALEPEHVFWFFYETNDVTYDLPAELRNEILASYLTDIGFRQGLMPRSAAIGRTMRRSFDEAWASLQAIPSPEPSSPPLLKRVIDVLKLTHLRSRLGLTVRDSPEPAVPGVSDAAGQGLWDSLARVLARAESAVAEWGGRLHFVYLPGVQSFLEEGGSPYHHRVLGIARELGIPVIDLYEVFSHHPDPLSLFAPLITEDYEYGVRVVRDRHYSREGNRMVADVVLRYAEDHVVT